MYDTKRLQIAVAMFAYNILIFPFQLQHTFESLILPGCNQRTRIRLRHYRWDAGGCKAGGKRQKEKKRRASRRLGEGRVWKNSRENPKQPKEKNRKQHRVALEESIRRIPSGAVGYPGWLLDGSVSLIPRETTARSATILNPDRKNVDLQFVNKGYRMRRVCQSYQQYELDLRILE